ncbi:hypothetical protein COLO4_28428 [Corchorus olitorius]|uniref:Reverse transcriptase zinc-binding domain-containing protein n=1 Tax=Corchorus olitorius TaxID=93759 RepID=A0A1R3HKZ4_9ROSI|nr:hypothetical protein COLO4_28428 [Corchorus olitorius]
MCLPIPRIPRSDSLIWNETFMGEFTVKSSYFVARRLLGWVDDIDDQQRQIWRQVWRANTLSKVQYFIWRLAWGLLPVKQILQQRGMDLDGRCVVCGEGEESINHAFFGFAFSRQVWELSTPWFLFVSMTGKENKTYGSA